MNGTYVADRGRQLLYPILSLALVAPLVWWFYWPAGDGLDVTGHQIGRDFLNNWIGPQLASDGQLLTLFDLQGYHAAIGRIYGHPLPFHNWGYPLFTMPFFWLFAQLPYFWALAVWTVGLFAIFAAVTLSQVDRAQRVHALIALMLAPACLINMIGGQNGFLSAALLIGGVLCIDKRPVLAGVLFGLLTFKPHLGIVLPFALIALRAWRVIAVAAVTAITLVAATLPFSGVEPWRLYIEVTGAYQALLLERFSGFYTIMMASVFAGVRSFGFGYATAMTLQIAVTISAIVAACWAVTRTTDPCRRAAVLACAAPLISPYAFNYDLTGMAAVLVWILAGRLPWRPALSPLYLFAWIAPTAMMHLNMSGIGIMPLALIGLFALAVREAAAGDAPERERAPLGLGSPSPA
jgi:hypothetical protein